MDTTEALLMGFIALLIASVLISVSIIPESKRRECSMAGIKANMKAEDIKLICR